MTRRICAILVLGLLPFAALAGETTSKCLNYKIFQGGEWWTIEQCPLNQTQEEDSDD